MVCAWDLVESDVWKQVEVGLEGYFGAGVQGRDEEVGELRGWEV